MNADSTESGTHHARTTGLDGAPLAADPTPAHLRNDQTKEAADAF